MMTWLQLGYHNKPVAMLNVANYYDALLEFLNTAHREGFVRPQHVDLVHSSSNIDKILEHFRAWWQRNKSLT